MGTGATVYAIIYDSVKKATLKISSNITTDKQQPACMNC